MSDSVNPMILRLLDANANRAREALRVVEDYARFVLNDEEIAGGLKRVRHELADALGPLLPVAILHRDTAGDVGTEIRTDAEQTRADLGHVVIAAGKRLGEALRSIEEFTKTISPEAAARVESLRYRFYDLEQKLARTLRPATRFDDVRLYVLITEPCCSMPWLEAAEEAIRGGADCLQLREKGLDSGELLRRAQALVALCRQHHVFCIINDRPDIAILSGADGVHVGQDDLPADQVRKLVGPDKIVGVSTHRIEQARRAVTDGADYIGVGPFFRSPTKPRDFVAGPAYAREVAESVKLPAVAIAGIMAQNVDEVLKTGLRAVAVTAAVIGAPDVRSAAAALKRKLVGQTFLSASSRSERPDELQNHRRRLPHWRLEGSTYFITFRLASGTLHVSERAIVMKHLKSGDERFYRLFAAVVMPDHVHLLLRPNETVELSRITRGIKGVSGRLLNSYRGRVGQVWQDESWDRIVRDQAEFDEKLEYMLHNPVKKGLVTDPWEYDAWYYRAESGGTGSE